MMELRCEPWSPWFQSLRWWPPHCPNCFMPAINVMGKLRCFMTQTPSWASSPGWQLKTRKVYVDCVFLILDHLPCSKVIGNWPNPWSLPKNYLCPCLKDSLLTTPLGRLKQSRLSLRTEWTSEWSHWNSSVGNIGMSQSFAMNKTYGASSVLSCFVLVQKFNFRACNPSV